MARKVVKQDKPFVMFLLKSLRLPVDEKVNLPPNIKHLDCNHAMIFMKKELMGYLFKVC